MRNYPARCRLWQSSEFGVIEFTGARLVFSWEYQKVQPNPKKNFPKAAILKLPAEVEAPLEKFLQAMAKNGYLVRGIDLHSPLDAEKILDTIDQLKKAKWRDRRP